MNSSQALLEVSSWLFVSFSSFEISVLEELFCEDSSSLLLISIFVFVSSFLVEVSLLLDSSFLLVIVVSVWLLLDCSSISLFSFFFLIHLNHQVYLKYFHHL